VVFSVICISHTDGSGGDVAGRIVAERLAWRYVDEELISEAARIARVDPSRIAATEKTPRRTVTRRVLEFLGSAQRGARGQRPSAADVAGTSVSDEELRNSVRAAIEAIATGGRAVIVAHAASMALGARADVLRVLVTAPNGIRGKRIARSRTMPMVEAATVITSGDKARREYLRAFYDVDDEQPTHYDLVISTETLTPEQTASLVLFAARGMPEPAEPRWAMLKRWSGR
jgi:cytidylate kinase